MPDSSIPPGSASIFPTTANTQKIHVDALKMRDRVYFSTAKASYQLTVGKNSHCILSSPDSSTRVGPIVLKGGTNADVTEYTPNRILLGGRLAYTLEDEATEMTTTPVIESLRLEPGLE